MKAVLTKEVGGPETLVVEDIDTPTPGKGEVLVDIAACAINFPDTLMIRDLYQFKPERPYSPGGEISGTIAAGSIHQVDVERDRVQRLRESLQVFVETKQAMAEGAEGFRDGRALDDPGIKDRQHRLVPGDQLSVEIGQGLVHWGPGRKKRAKVYREVVLDGRQRLSYRFGGRGTNRPAAGPGEHVHGPDGSGNRIGGTDQHGDRAGHR